MLRTDYRHFLSVSTRWMDGDTYGHVNNVAYYAYFDTAVNEHLIRHRALDPNSSNIVGFVVETSCRYHRPLTFPEVIDVGLRVTRLGNTSVRYEVAIFKQNEDQAAADGHFVHVWVDRASRRPTPVPAAVREALSPLVV